MEEAIPIIAILAIFVFIPWMVFHHITLWRKQKTLQPDDERMMEDLWRAAKRMERRIETLEALMSEEPRRPSGPRPTDTDYRRD
ncbi:MAG: envelope stress response membrane protein PspB [Pseudomonadota bacterium]